MSFFAPNATFLCYRDVTAEFLRALGVRVLLLDIDNTLAPYEQPDPDEAIASWLNALAKEGITAAFLSNNHGERVERFNRTLRLSVRCNAKKPLPGNAKKLLRSLNVRPENAALLGDQIFTDVLCAHLAGMHALLVPPIKDRTDCGTRFKRWMEKGILKRYYKKHPTSPDVRKVSPLRAEFERRYAGEETKK